MILPRAEQHVPITLVTGNEPIASAGTSAPTPTHACQTVGLAVLWEQEENVGVQCPPYLAGTSFPQDCGKGPAQPQGDLNCCAPHSHPIQPLWLVGSCVDAMIASPGNSSKALKDCPRGSYYQHQPTGFGFFSPGGENRCQSAMLQRESASPLMWAVSHTGMHNGITKATTTN